MSTERLPARQRWLSVAAAMAVLPAAGGPACWVSMADGGPPGAGRAAPPPRPAVDGPPERGGGPVSGHAVIPGDARWTGGAEPERQPVDGYRAEGRSLELTFWAGVCEDYTASVTESDTQMRVRVRAVQPEEQRMCVQSAKRQTVRVALDEPLGGRAVVDGRTDLPLPRG